MNSLRLRFALWFGGSLLVVLAVFSAITWWHLRNELRIEKWERSHPDHKNWVLHGSYSEEEVQDIVGELTRSALLYAFPVAALSLLLGYILAARAFRPVETLRAQLNGIGPSSLEKRVSLGKAGEELKGIESHINALLVRLEESFRQLTEYSAHVAHELRTPLTLLRLKVEEASGSIDPALAESLQEELARLGDYVDQCLLLATAQQRRLHLSLSTIDPSSEVADMLETYELLAREEGRTIEFHKGEVRSVSTDPRYFRQLVHTLLTNALKHGEGPVRVEFHQDKTLCCEISNTPASFPRHKGQGLGLRLASALADCLGLALTTASSPDRYRARLQFPGNVSLSHETPAAKDQTHA